MTKFTAFAVFVAVAFVATAMAPGLIYSPLPLNVVAAALLVLCFFAVRAARRKLR